MQINLIQNSHYIQNHNNNKSSKTSFGGLKLSEEVMDIFAKDITDGTISTERTQEILANLKNIKFNMLAQMKKWAEIKGEELQSRFPEFLEKFSNACKRNGMNPEDVDLVLVKEDHDKRSGYITTHYDNKSKATIFPKGNNEFGGYTFKLKYSQPAIKPSLWEIGISESSLDSIDRIPWEGFFENDQLIFNNNVPLGLTNNAPLQSVCRKFGTAESILKKKDSIEKGANYTFDRIARLIDSELKFKYNDKTYKELSDTTLTENIKK